MSDQDTQHARELYEEKLKRLKELEKQAAKFGLHCPPHITLEIEGLRPEIEQLQRLLAIEGVKLEQATVIISKYREPLLRAAQDLQSRLFSIVERGFLQIYFRKSEKDRTYALSNTLFVVAEYLSWTEIVRREARFLDLGTVEATRRLDELLIMIGLAFSRDDIDLTFRLFRGEQRAIGEIMIVGLGSPHGGNLETIGYAEFVQRLEQPTFSRWFTGLQQDIEVLCDDPSGGHEVRLIKLQHTLIDLIDFLDPHCTRIPGEYRQKIAHVRIV